MANAPHHEAQRLSLLVVQGVEEVGKAADEARAGGAQSVQPGVQQLLRWLTREPLASDEVAQFGPARRVLQCVALALEFLEPGAEKSVLPVVQVQLAAHSCEEEMGKAISMAAERMAMAAVAEVMVELVVRMPATKKVHGAAPWAVARWLGWRP